jgi:trehalose 6-phosphate phosphatase
VQAGAMVSELRTPGPHKGDALRDVMAETPFNGFTPVMVGDDLTDEAAFAAAADLGGWGILAGRPRPTAALYRLDGVDAVMAWLLEGLR